MPRMYGILAVAGWVATIIVAVLLVILPKRPEPRETQSSENFEQ